MTELQVQGKQNWKILRGDPWEKAVGNCLFCLSLKAAMKRSGETSKYSVERGRRGSLPWAGVARADRPSLGVSGDMAVARCACRRNHKVHPHITMRSF